MKLKSYTLIRFTFAMFLASASGLHAQEASLDAVDSFFKGILPEGKILLDSRLRHETADQQGFAESSRALTLRTRFGYQTESYSGFQALVEGEWIQSLLDKDDYNAAGRNAGARSLPIIADPETTELNQLWLSYKTENTWLFKLGRQIIALDDHRFIGHVGWRQNIQTYDAFAVKGSITDNVQVFYSYLDRVHRIFGDDWPDHAGPVGEFDSDSHLFNLSFSKTPVGTITAFAYLVGLEEAPVESSATYGLRLSGSKPLGDGSIAYTTSVATQSDYQDNPHSYQGFYFEGSLTYSHDSLQLGAGYELLGSDAGIGFSTPLATLHKFNGWADVFLSTPSYGLQDLYLYFSYKLPIAKGLVFKAYYHAFESDVSSVDLGSELDLLMAYKFSKYLSATVKYADYNQGDTGTAGSREKFSIQLDFIY